ncbi:ABC transporter substrate-binding protein [Aeromicrobium yanjiei]|uniref:ABC transporter substrate-binding protein n=2 Tax=Aeromicrobium yanjiei TaxID=2662028 RepID=A0A5Q2MEN7_9ACTN|nr:ABC transporter substrate-binding protein [Aeromicrobium yanjiei]
MHSKDAASSASARPPKPSPEPPALPQACSPQDFADNTSRHLAHSEMMEIQMMGKTSRAIALAMASALVVAACGGSTDSGGKGDGGGDVDKNGTLRFGFTVPAMPLDPHTTVTDTGQYAFVAPLYDRLTQITDGPKLEPMLATKWEFAPDGKSATFTLREGVTFSDGAELDAEAVKKSLDRALTHPKTTAPTKLNMIESVEVVSPTEVKISTKRPAADLPYTLAGSYGSIISPKALDNPDLDVKPVGSGPYVLKEIKLGESATYTRREGYWDPKAQQAKTIVIRGIADDNARLNALRSGQIDMMISKVGQANQAKKLGENFGFHSYPAAATYALQVNVDHENLDQVKVRQALNWAIDRDAINDSLLNGQCRPNNQPLTQGFDGFLEDPPVAYDYDPAKAKTLLAEAGVSDGFKMQLLVGAGLSPQDKMAPVLQAQFKEIGVDAEIVEQDLAQASGNYSKSDFDSYLQTRVAGPSSAITLQKNFDNPATFPGTLPAEILKSINKGFDPSVEEATALKALESASAAINEQALDVFICALPTQVAYSDKVVGADTMGQSYFQGIPDLRYVGIAD